MAVFAAWHFIIIKADFGSGGLVNTEICSGILDALEGVKRDSTG